ncbi:RIP metalloprotease RseP [Patescibacteria group bacterium]
MIILAIITFILVFGLLIFVHELGHFLVAKKMGVKVEEFGFGYPPRIFGIKRGETIYSLNWIPLGGFVKMLGQDDFDVKGNLKKSGERNFNNKSIYKRALIMIAGVVMNFILAWVLIVIGFGVGMPTLTDGVDRFKGAEIKTNILVMEVSKNSPAEQAEMKISDIIRKTNGKEITSKVELQDFTKKNQGKEVSIEIERKGDRHILETTLRKNPAENQGALGIGVEESSVVKYPWYKAIWIGTKETVYLIGLVVVALYGFFKEIFVSLHISDQAAGPVGIAKMSGSVAQLGWIYLLQFVALLSINLGIINILPFPALDGGRLLFLGIEKVRRKPISLRIENIVHLIGFGLIIILLIAVTYKDILRFFR